jgi:hypothetical protein
VIGSNKISMPPLIPGPQSNNPWCSVQVRSPNSTNPNQSSPNTKGKRKQEIHYLGGYGAAAEELPCQKAPLLIQEGLPEPERAGSGPEHRRRRHRGGTRERGAADRKHASTNRRDPPLFFPIDFERDQDSAGSGRATAHGLVYISASAEGRRALWACVAQLSWALHFWPIAVEIRISFLSDHCTLKYTDTNSLFGHLPLASSSTFAVRSRQARISLFLPRVLTPCGGLTERKFHRGPGGKIHALTPAIFGPIRTKA